METCFINEIKMIILNIHLAGLTSLFGLKSDIFPQPHLAHVHFQKINGTHVPLKSEPTEPTEVAVG